MDVLTPARLIQQRTAIINHRWRKSRFFKMYHLFQEMSVCPLQPSSQASAGNKPKSLFHFLKAKKKTKLLMSEPSDARLIKMAEPV